MDEDTFLKKISITEKFMLLDWLIESAFLINNGRSSSDLDKVRPGCVNRHNMENLIHTHISKYRDLGYRVDDLRRASRRALLLWKAAGFVKIKETILRGGSSFTSNIEVSFPKLLSKDRSLKDFLIYSYEPYKLISLESGEEFLFSNSFFSLKRVRILSKKNINTCSHGVEGALILSQTPITVDKDSAPILKDELENEFCTSIEGDLLNRLGNIGVGIEDLKNPDMGWWDVILENSGAARELNKSYFIEGRERFNLPTLKRRLSRLVRSRNSIIKDLNSSLGLTLTSSKVSSYFFKKDFSLPKKNLLLLENSNKFNDFLALKQVFHDIDLCAKLLKGAETEWAKSHSWDDSKDLLDYSKNGSRLLSKLLSYHVVL